MKCGALADSGHHRGGLGAVEAGEMLRAQLHDARPVVERHAPRHLLERVVHRPRRIVGHEASQLHSPALGVSRGKGRGVERRIEGDGHVGGFSLDCGAAGFSGF
jgi:hypothetical protein